MKILGGGGSNAKPPEMENPVGWGVKLEKTLRGGGMDIFWKHTLCPLCLLVMAQTDYCLALSFSLMYK